MSRIGRKVMRLLMVTPELPYPLDQGGRIRMFFILKHLSTKHEIHLVTNTLFPTTNGYKNELAKYCQSISFVQQPFSRLRSAGRLFQSSLARKPYIVYKYYSAELAKQVKSVAEAIKPDCLLIESQYLAQCAEAVNVPAVIDFHDIASQLYARFASNPKWNLKKLHGKVQYGYINQFEKQLPHHLHACTVMSDNDKEYLQRLSNTENIFVVPNGVDLAYFNPDLVAEKPTDLVFSGSMDYFPNIDAVHYLYENIMPKIWKSRPETTVTVVGRDPASSIVQLGRDKRILITGKVPDIRPYLKGASIVIVPLRLGSGTKLKVLEAAAMAKPIISTPVGLEGICFQNQQQALVASTADMFSNLCLQLLNDRPMRISLGKSAQHIAVEKYGWETCVSQFELVLSAVVD